ncbi:AT-rich interactive domain-containing protein 2 isoform X3 [Culex quinquefasciatus]|uniref:AT-rich interactive domain-containing protein 2 isoform X3 n=1 Tax=Culex quinquefasciatus TaxID=7176 RepID=UPI0018E37EDF|nr:AT-rich interactive domain-containing protein 2 isoform X3 [Culex quinquefasciatus]
MTADGSESTTRIKAERGRSQDSDGDAFVSQNSSSGTPSKEGAGRGRGVRGKLVFEKDKASFLQDLQLFHDRNGTPFMRLPKIGGRDVDLHRLYSVVVARGGWLKVNSREDWDEIIEEMALPKRCVNNEIALKQIYIRFLDKYEKVNFHGEEKDPTEEEDDEKRHNRRWSARMLHSVPAVYNHQQHYVPEVMRGQLGMSCELYKHSEYDKLILSLLSPLPNEQDFSINVCTLMSNESKHTLKVDRCPKLITVLLAHAGVFNHFSLRDMFDEYYANIRKNSLHRFWKDCLYEKPQVLELSYSDYFQKLERDPTNLIKNIYGEDLDKDEDCGQLEMGTLRSFLSLGSGLGTNDYIGQRILQIASIFRNLSFNDENILVLGKHRPFLRFLIMLSNSRWGNLHHMGLDMLGNVSVEIDINDPQTDEITRSLLSTLWEGLEGDDRGVIISCLEVLSKIAQKESNEDNLNRCLNQEIYDQICRYLSLSDIMLLLYTLECIYSLTSMGEKPCNSIMHVTGIIDTLVSLVTVEAQSYGPDACILMRVVETIPGNLAGTYPGNHYHNTGPVPPPQAPSMAQLTVQNKEQPPIPLPNIPALPGLPAPPKSATPPISTAPTPVQVTSATRPVTSQSPQIPVNVIPKPPSTPTAPTPPSTTQPTTVAAKHALQQQSQENEQFALAWLRATFEPTPSLANRIEQAELYKLYLAANAKIGRKAVVPQVHLPRCVRTVFGGTVGPTQVKSQAEGGGGAETVSFYYEGIRLKAKPAVATAGGVTSQKVVHPPTVDSSPKTSANSSAPKAGEQKSNQPPVDTCKSQISTSTTATNQPPKLTIPASAPMAKPQSVIKQAGAHQKTVPTNQPKQQHATTLAAKPTPTVVASKPLQPQQQQQQQPSSSPGGGATKPIIMTQVGAGKSVVNYQKSVCNPPAQLLQQVLNSNQSGETKNVIVVNQTTISPQPLGTIVAPPQPPQQTTGTTTIMNQSGTISSTTTNPSALIKSLLANKVTTTTTMPSSESGTGGNLVVVTSSTSSSLSSTTTSINPSTTSNCLIASNVNVHQVAQRQQLLKQKQLNAAAAQLPNSSVVVTSNSPNNLTNIKVGNSTISIKPGTLPTNTVITATQQPQELQPPPLAPLSQPGGGAVIKPLTTNKLLADLLDKKTNDPPVFAIGETTVKRKSDVDGLEPPNKKIDLMTGVEEVKVTPKAADLYAELAGSILEGEDLEDVEMKVVKEEVKVQPAPAQSQVITVPMPMQRQIIMNPNNPQQMLLSPGGTGQQLTTQTTATIKTDTGYQTVPIIMQHNQSPIQIQKAAPVMQPTVIGNQQQPTQYILATNPQGQTYVVAQQPQPQPQLQQTVLLTQNPQTGAQQKTIIILQQQPNAGPHIQGQQIVQTQQQTPQKVFVNQQGQQIIMTQVPRQVQHQVIVSHAGTNPSGTATVVGPTIEKKPIYITTNSQGNTISIDGQTQQIIKTNQPATQIIQHLGGTPQQQQQSQQIQHLLQQSGSQTIQIIQQPPQQQQQIVAQPSQIVIQAQPHQQQQQQMQPQIISQQIIQPATVQQPQMVQKVIQQKLIQVPQPQPQQIMTMQAKQTAPVQQPSTITVTKQTVPAPVAGTLPTKTIIGTTPQKQMIQVVQQKAAANPPIITKPTPPNQPAVEPAHQKASTTATVVAATPTTNTPVAPTSSSSSSSSIQMIPAMDPAKAVDEDVDASWPWVCDWRGCPRKKFASANEVYKHACAVHAPESLESSSDIYCQWGPGPNLCDNLPRKRFSLMTHIFDRHCTSESFKSAVQRRVANATAGTQQPQQAYPVTLVRQPAGTPPGSSASSTTSESAPLPAATTTTTTQGPQLPGHMSAVGPAALHAIKRHAIDWVNAKEFQDDIEGPVTKSIRLTSALILRNLVVYSNTARRNLRAYEPHLAGVAMNNVEASRTISQVLFEMNDTNPNSNF